MGAGEPVSVLGSRKGRRWAITCTVIVQSTGPASMVMKPLLRVLFVGLLESFFLPLTISVLPLEKGCASENSAACGTASSSVIGCHCRSLLSIIVVRRHCPLLLSVILLLSVVCCRHHCVSLVVVFAVFSLVVIICSHASPVVIVSRCALVVVTGHHLSLSVIIPAMAKGTGQGRKRPVIRKTTIRKETCWRQQREGLVETERKRPSKDPLETAERGTSRGIERKQQNDG